MEKVKKVILLGFFLFLVAYFGFVLFDLVIYSVLQNYNVNWRVYITQRISIDVYGGIAPTVASLLIALCLVRFRGFSFKSYLSNFAFPIAFGFLVSSPTIGGIAVRYKILALLVSFWSVALSICDGSISVGVLRSWKLHGFSQLNFDRRRYVNALMVAYSYASFSVLVVDLAYLPFGEDYYIGAMGLMDGIMLSGLVTFVGVTIGALFVMFMLELYKLPSRKLSWRLHPNQ